MNKKLYILNILIIVIFISYGLQNVAYADVTFLEKKQEIRKGNLYIVPKYIRDNEIDHQVKDVISRNELIKSNGIYLIKDGDNNIIPNSRVYYSTEVVSTKYITLGGYAGNQSPGGHRFQTGGGFWWQDNGSPKASGTVSFSYPYKLITVSIGLGVSGWIGYT